MAVVAADKYPSVEIDTGDHTPIAEDEVVFVLRAKDDAALETLRFYAAECERLGAPLNHLDAVNVSIEQFTAWRHAHPEIVRTPD